MSATEIEWTDVVWNPVRGCVKVSPGCKHCYANTFAERFRGVPGIAYERGFDPRLVPERLADPLRWEKPRKVFVNSMSDLFQAAVPDDYLEEVCRVMQAADWHVFQVLTKRPERMRDLLRGRLAFAAALPHVWWGTSVEDKKYGLPRIDVLRDTPAATRFLSAEPLLENLGRVDLQGIDWVIVGGESGPGARPMDPAWAEGLRDQCVEAGVKFFFKQWGGVRKAVAGRVLAGRTHDEYPASSAAAVPDRRVRLAMVGDAADRAAGFSPG